MARPKSPILTEGELRLMKILWQLGAATVKDITDALADTENLAYTTVLSTLQTLTRKGAVKPEKQGRAYLYRPVIKQAEARRSAVRYILSRFFDGSADSLVLNILNDEEIEDETIKRLREALQQEGGERDDGR